MFLKIDQPYTATLLVTDINGNRVLNDTPVAIVKNTQNNLYFNGIAWQGVITELAMTHVGNAVYSKQIASFPESGVYSVTATSSTYSITKVETVEVYDTNLMHYTWLVNNPFLISYAGVTNTDVVRVKISRNLDGMQWDGTNWVLTETFLTMPLLSDTIYTYTFTPTIESEYSVTVVSGDNELFYILDVTVSGDNVPPILINNKTFRSSDGTDGTLVDEAGITLPNVTISIFDLNTKEIIGKTLTNSRGEWSILIKPGTYYFMFEKDGYTSIGLERTVV